MLWRFLSRRLAALLVAAALANPAVAARSAEDPQAFADRALPHIRAAFPDAAIALEPGDPLQVNVTRPGEEDAAQINLHRVFGYCQNAPEADCEIELARMINVLASAPRLADPDVRALRIIFRDSEYWSYVIGSKLDAVPLHRQIGKDLYAILAFDSPEAIAIAPPDRIAELGLSEENAWQFAAWQTEKILPGLPESGPRIEGLTVFEGEEYTGSMMAYPERWEALAKANGPDLAVIVNSDQFVVAAVVPDGPELERYRDLAGDQCKLAPRCISPNVYRWRDGRWVIAP